MVLDRLLGRSFLIIIASTLIIGCAARAPVPIALLNDPPCSLAAGILWAGPKEPDHRTRLNDWCKSVGSILIHSPKSAPLIDVARSGLIILTWNKHVDFGDLESLLRSLVGRSAVVALLQEVARSDISVPLEVPSTVRVPGRIGPRQPSRDVKAIAEELNMSLAYLPSMPNGSRTSEDRGCAILSTLPMSDVIGIELPWVSQRRVAVMTTLTAMNNGVPWRLRAVSIHLDNRLQRSQQAAAIAGFLSRNSSSDLPLVIGGDLNSWLGIKDRSVQEIDRLIPRVGECGSSGTFRFGLRLDHLFTTLPKQARADCVVVRNRFGSDHNPIVLYLFSSAIKQ